ncbi:MAG: dipeptide epimerase [Kiritimatiellae bacterium]|nr:dipeptide epimerase [Kiritimatiellia bacterium]
MQTTTVTFRRIDLRLTEPYVIAYETIETAANVFLRIETDSGLCGCGCAAPDEQVTGETPDTVLRACEEIVRPALAESDPARVARVLATLEPRLAGQPSVLAMVDMALYDLLARHAGLPLYRLLGGLRDTIMTSVTIGIRPAADTVAKARQLAGAGIRAIKLKGGTDVEDDVARVLAVREALGEQVELRFDANQGYTVDDTVRFARATAGARLELIEQPTPRHEPALLAEAARRVSVPIMADESLLTLEDALALAKRGGVAMLNIKLMKVGGIGRAFRIAAVAQAAGMKVMVGCMDETALAIAAGLHFSLACPAVHYADLDSHLDLIDDPTRGAVTLRDGLLAPSPQPGLGCSFRLAP